MSDEEAKLSRREFVKYSALTTVAVGGLYSLTTMTDARAEGSVSQYLTPHDDPPPYYTNVP